MTERPSKSTRREVMEKVTEAGLSAVPFIGGPLAVVFATAVGWSISRRTDEWLADLAAEVERLGLVIEDLAEQPAFVDAVVTATRAAQATHQEEKLQALRNGVLHTISPDAPDVDEQLRFFRLIAKFSPAHLTLLTFMHDPGAAFDSKGLERPQIMGGQGYLLEQAHPPFAGQREWYDLLHADLSAAGLINSGGLATTMSTGGLYQARTTALGARFLAFVGNPS